MLAPAGADEDLSSRLTPEDLFRFALRPGAADRPLEDVVGDILRAVLDVVCLTNGGDLLEPDGFVYHRDAFSAQSETFPIPHSSSPLPEAEQHGPVATTKQVVTLLGSQEREDHYYDRGVLVRTEARIEMFLRLAEALNEVLAFDVPAPSDVLASARLRSLTQWQVDSDRDPYEVIAGLTRNCNARCSFCYVHGNPSDSVVRLNTATTERSAQEARVRLDFYERGLRLPQPTYDLEETLLHPEILPTLRRIRASGETLISLTTNGAMLDRRMVEQLAELQPLEITLSLNSADPALRRSLMGPQAERGIEALRLLDDAGLRVATTLVAWPTIPLDRLAETVRFADRHDVRVINLILGGYTRYFPSPPELDTFTYWREVVEAIAPLRDEVEHPLSIQPGLFAERVLHPDRLGEVEVTGIAPRSPAAASDLRRGDVIVAVGREPVRTRSHCLALLALLRDTESVRANLTVRRYGREREVVLPRTGAPGYRYGPPTNDRFGIHLTASSPSLTSIRQVYDLVKAYRARHVLLFSSAVVSPLVDQMLAEWSGLGTVPDARIVTVAPENRYYGGSIVLGDLLTVEDLTYAYEAYARRNGQPDLVLVPSAPFNSGGWLRDIRGTSFFALRSALPAPCELIMADNFE